MVQIMEKVTLDVAQEKEAMKDKDKESSAGPSSCNSKEMSVENAIEETVSVPIFDHFLILFIKYKITDSLKLCLIFTSGTLESEVLKPSFCSSLTDQATLGPDSI